MAHDGWPHATAMAHGGCKVAACRCGFPATAVGHDVCQTAVGHGGRRGPRRLVVKTEKF
jgi:hypothetical protein